VFEGSLGQGLPSKELHTVFCALIVSRILYALPAWGGLLTADLIGKIDAYLCKALRWGYNGNVKLLSLHDADMKLFKSMLHSTHCIHQFLFTFCLNASCTLTLSAGQLSHKIHRCINSYLFSWRSSGMHTSLKNNHFLLFVVLESHLTATNGRKYGDSQAEAESCILLF